VARHRHAADAGNKAIAPPMPLTSLVKGNDATIADVIDELKYTVSGYVPPGTGGMGIASPV